MPKKEAEPEPKIHVCDFCGKEYKTRQGLHQHKKVCEYRPTGETDITPEDKDGVTLFDDDEDETPPKQVYQAPEGEPVYGCPYCGADMTNKYMHCPECGGRIIWD